VIRLLLIIQVPHASDKRSVAVSFCPIDRFSLCFEGAEHMVHMVFDNIIVDGASLRPTLGTGLNVYVGHDFLSLGSFVGEMRITQSLNRCQPLYLHSAARCLAGSSQQATKLSPVLGGQDGASKPA